MASNKIEDCLGYAVLRRVNRAHVTPPLACVAFADNRAPVQANQDGQPSTTWPYQRFTWTDHHPEDGDVVEYRVVSMMGTPDFPRQGGLLSNWVEARKPQFPIEDYLGRVGIVVVHSKVIVIDPLGDHPVLMTGSHNMGVKAATVNDDNLVIIENDRDVALSYAINVISTFNHFWWRHNMAPPKERKAARDDPDLAGTHTKRPTTEWKGLHPDDTWQDKFYREPTEANEVKFWGLPV